MGWRRTDTLLGGESDERGVGVLDYVIKGGTIVDGSGGPPATGDVGVRDGVIVSVAGTIT